VIIFFILLLFSCSFGLPTQQQFWIFWRPIHIGLDTSLVCEYVSVCVFVCMCALSVDVHVCLCVDAHVQGGTLTSTIPLGRRKFIDSQPNWPYRIL